MRGLHAYLSTLDRDRLVDLLTEAARRDRATERRLRAAVGQPDDQAALRAAVERAFATDGPLSYWSSIRYERSAAEVTAALEAMVSEGHAADACPLLERAITLLSEATGEGELDGLMRRLLTSHAEACRAARPDPVTLARWLLELRCAVDVAAYAPALAEAGLAVYREEVGRRWAADPTDLAAREAVEHLARLDRDVTTLVTLIGGDLRQPAQYAKLARALYEIGATDAALSWAEQGLRAHPNDPAGLRDFLVEAYLHRGGSGDAIAMRRDGLRATPHLRAYAALRATAGQAGCWAAERPAALRTLRRHNPADHVRALLHEESDPEAAWSAARSVPDLDAATWDELARHRARSHPAQAAPVMRRRLDEVLNGTGRDVYRDAARRLVELREVSSRAGRTADFDAYLRTLLDQHCRRPAFLAELAEAGLLC